MNKNILKEADSIVNERSEEKTREYGSFSEGMERAAKILSSLRGKEFDAHDMYAAMVALKFSRQSFNFKTDNLLDAVAYIGAWENYIQEQKTIQEIKPSTFGPNLADFLKTVSESLILKHSKDEIIKERTKDLEKSVEEAKQDLKNKMGVPDFKKAAENLDEALEKNDSENIGFSEYVAEQIDIEDEGTSMWKNQSLKEYSAASSFSEASSAMYELINTLKNVVIDLNQKMTTTEKYIQYLAENIDQVITHSDYIVNEFNDRFSKLTDELEKTNFMVRDGDPEIKYCWIKINGNIFPIGHKSSISYNEILNEIKLKPKPEINYSITYEKGNPFKPDGILIPGEKVKLENGMCFYVQHTGNA